MREVLESTPPLNFGTIGKASAISVMPSPNFSIQTSAELLMRIDVNHSTRNGAQAAVNHFAIRALVEPDVDVLRSAHLVAANFRPGIIRIEPQLGQAVQ
jgi:hypothetical protein